MTRTSLGDRWYLPDRRSLTRWVARSGRLAALFVAALFLALGCTSPSNFLAAQDAVQTATGTKPSPENVENVSLPAAEPGQLALGTNLTSISDWSSQMPFLNAFKFSRQWIPQCEEGQPDCASAWDTHEFDKLDLDEQGWVKSLPAPDDPPQYTQVGTFVFRDLDRYPGGQYVVLYDGEGKIVYKFDGKKNEAASRPGRDVVDVTPSTAGLFLIITATDPNKTGNYLRNIRVVPIAYEQTFRQQIFNPEFLERTRPFSTLRFMDWMLTNNSQQKEWANRPQVEDASYAIQGVPIEIMIELANRLQANPWFNMPHQATDEYITNFARLVKDRLDPSLKAYVEFSNEVWNWQFQQAHYALEQGKARWGQDQGDAFAQWYGMRAAQMSDIWKREFGDQGDRVISVIATQTGWQGLEGSILNCPDWVAEGNRPCYQHGFTAYAATGYFSGNLGSRDNMSKVQSWMREPDGGIAKAFEQLGMNGTQGDSVGDTAKSFRYQAEVAKRHGLRLVVYEGGQSIAGQGGAENDEAMVNFFISLNRHPKMGECYTDLLNEWQAAGGTLFMHFADIAVPSKWGSWGALESVMDSRSPKYDALMNFIERNKLR